MALITRVNHGATASRGTTGIITPGEPASVATKDVLVCYVSQAAGNNLVTMGGEWTRAYGTGSAISANGWAFYTTFTGVSPSYTVNVTTGGFAVVVAYRGGFFHSAFGSNFTGSATPQYGSLVTEQDNEMLVHSWHHDSATVTNGAINGTDPTLTEELDTADATAVLGLGYSDGIKTIIGTSAVLNTDGTTSARTSTFSGSVSGTTGSIIIMPFPVDSVISLPPNQRYA